MSTNVATLPTNPPPKRKLLQQLADRYGVEPDVFLRTMAAVAMPTPHTEEDLISCLIVANEHDLNPLTKEIHFMRDKMGRIQPIVGVDGWVKKLNDHPKFNGLKFDYEWDDKKKLVAVTCTIWRKDRDHPIVVTEFMSECFRPAKEGKANAWSTNPMRMLRHRALVQGTRYAMGLGGIMDLDEFERWQEMKDITPPPAQAVLDVPDDIPTEIAKVPVTEAEENQDAPISNPDLYAARAKENLAGAATEDEWDEVWATHQEIVEAGRLPSAVVTELDAWAQKDRARFDKRGKRR